jgi:hypothetical protein
MTESAGVMDAAHAGSLTPVWAGIGGDVPQEDDGLGIEAVDEGGEALSFDVANG